MKSISWIVNGVLAVAVIVLFVLHFSTNSTPTKASINDKGGVKIAYFEIDSIQNSYEFFKEVKSSLQVKDMENTKQLTNLKNEYIAKYQELQKNAQFLSQAEVASRQQDLVKAEKNYTAKEQQLSQELQEESFKRLQEVKKKIEVFLANYNKNKEFAFILSSNADLMYYKDTTYDITADALHEAIKDYKSKK